MRGHVSKQRGFRAKGGGGRGEGVGRGSGREAGGTASGQRRAGKCNGSSTMVTTECMNNTAIPLLTLTTEI